MEQLAYRIEEAAERIGISRSKCYELIAQGDLPHLKIGKSLRVPVDGLRKWIERRTNGAGAK